MRGTAEKGCCRAGDWQDRVGDVARQTEQASESASLLSIDYKFNISFESEKLYNLFF